MSGKSPANFVTLVFIALVLFSQNTNFLGSFIGVAEAAVPKVISYQGRLEDSIGNLQGSSSGTNFDFKFSIWNVSSTDSGTRLWPTPAPASTTLKVYSGVFDARLGDTSQGFAALDLDFNTSTILYLEIGVWSSSTNQFETLSPRQPIVSSGFAINASTLNSFTQGTSSNNLLLLDQNGSVILQTGATVSSTNVSTTNISASGFIQGGTVNVTTVSSTNLFASGYLQILGQSNLGNVSSSNLSASGFLNASSANISFVSSTNITLSGNLVNTGLTSTRCLRVGAGGLITVASTDCLTGSGNAGGWINATSSGEGYVLLTTNTNMVNIGGAATSTASSSKVFIQSTTVSTTTLTLNGLANQTANLLIISSSTNQQFFTVSAMGVVSSTEARINSSTITGLTFINATGSTLTLTASGTNALALIGLPQLLASSSLFQLGPNIIQGGNASGTFIGINPTAFSGDFINFQVNSSTKFQVTGTGGLTINGSDSSIVRTTTADFTTPFATEITNLTNTNNQLELSDGTVSGDGTITAAGALSASTTAAVADGALGITRPDGKYFVLLGGTSTAVYDSVANTFTAGTALAAAAGAGSLALPLASGRYELINGGGTSTRAVIDPQQTLANVADAGANFCATAGAGTNAWKRLDGRFLVGCGGLATTALLDPVAGTWAAGPSLAQGTFGAGSVPIPMLDGRMLTINGGATTTTNIYSPHTGTGNIGTYVVGPSLPTGCEMNGAGGIVIRKQDGKYIVLSKINVSAIFDPNNQTFSQNAGSCTTPTAGSGPTVALADGAHAISMQDGRFLIIIGGGSTVANIYNPQTDTFTAHATAITAGGAGRISLMNHDGTYLMIAGAGSTGTGCATAGTCTDKFDSQFVMSGQYRSDNISTTNLNINSTLRWTAQFEAPFVGRNATSTLQFFVRTATSTANLGAAIDREILSSGDLIRPDSQDAAIRITVKFTRPIPKRTYDERGTWIGNSNIVSQLDFTTPTLFDIMVDNSNILRRDGLSFNLPYASYNNPATSPAPAALTAAAPTAGGACTTGTHTYKYTYVISASSSSALPPYTESLPSAASGIVTCTATTSTVALSGITTGPTGTTARKVYRTFAGDTSDFYLLTTINDNTVTTFTDTVADSALTSLLPGNELSGPVMKGIEALPDRLYLPLGRIPPSTVASTTAGGYYFGNSVTAHPSLPQAQTNLGTMVIARPNKTFKIIAALTTPAANGAIYDPATQTFSALQAAPNIPTAANGAGGFALKRPDGKFLVVLGNATALTNIYDPVADTFVAGPSLANGVAADGASAIPNTDGTYTIVQGATAVGGATASTVSTIYDPVRNTMIVGPTLITGSNSGFFAIPLRNGNYRVGMGQQCAATAVSTSTSYDPRTKIFTIGPAITAAVGCGAYAFQKADNWWEVILGQSLGVGRSLTQIVNPDNGTDSPNVPLVTNISGIGALMIPRADGTFLALNGATTTNIIIPFGNFVSNNFSGLAQIGYVPIGPILPTAIGAGAVAFQRPDGKFVLINGSSTATTQLLDVGWYPDGQYLSEQMNVPALTTNSTLDWQQTADSYIRMEVRYAASQAALGRAAYVTVGRPGQSFFNPGGETWVQVKINMRRDFPTFGGTLDGVYNTGGGMVYPYRNISTPTLFNYRINNGIDLLTLQTNGLNVLRVTQNGDIMSSPQGGFFSGGADLAERYTSTDYLVPGEVVVADYANSQGVKKSTGQYQNSLLGVVSTAPGFVAGSYTKDSYPIALVGRVPVKVSSENGPILAGDYLTSASIPGYAMKATFAGRVIGKALEDADTRNRDTCPAFALGLQKSTKCGTVMMFVNLINYNGAPIDVVVQEWKDRQAAANDVAAASGLAAHETRDTGLAFSGASTTLPSSTSTPPVVFSSPGAATSRESDILEFLTNLKKERASSIMGTQSELFADNVHVISELISPRILANILAAKEAHVTSIEGLDVSADTITAKKVVADALVSSAGTLGFRFTSDGKMVLFGTSAGSTYSTSSGQTDSPQASSSVDIASTTASSTSIALGTVTSTATGEPILITFDTKGSAFFAGNVVTEGVKAKSLSISGAAVVSGGLIVNSIGSDALSSLAILSDATFFGRPYFNSDTGGFAKIPKSATSVDITFAGKYADEPVVNTNISLGSSTAVADIYQIAQNIFASDVKFLIVNKTVKGFTIELNKPAPEDITFSWIALAVKDAKTFGSAPSVAPTPPTSAPILLSPAPLSSLPTTTVPTTTVPITTIPTSTLPSLTTTTISTIPTSTLPTSTIPTPIVLVTPQPATSTIPVATTTIPATTTVPTSTVPTIPTSTIPALKVLVTPTSTITVATTTPPLLLPPLPAVVPSSTIPVLTLTPS